MERSGWNGTNRYGLVVLVSLIATTLLVAYSSHAQEAEANPPSLDLILDSLERTAQQNPALSEPYEVTREYKVFRENDPMPVSHIMAQISFTPPETKTFQITKTEGSPRGKRIVSTILKQEIDSAKDGHRGDITRSNYNLASFASKTLVRFPSTCCTSFPSARKGACSSVTFGWTPRRSASARSLGSRSRIPRSGSRTFTSPSNSPT